MREELADIDPEIILFEGLDDALMGYMTRFSPQGHTIVALYDRAKCVELFMGQGMTWEEAEEWMSYNVEGLYAGPYTPAFFHRVETS